mmetsp:Transcript_143327/g.264294  ORF Transcript_143327/g.264294 Transcript_143327/m.264294 type:complete len:89 (-) Transcript_143327:68-334(-)
MRTVWDLPIGLIEVGAFQRRQVLDLTQTLPLTAKSTRVRSGSGITCLHVHSSPRGKMNFSGVGLKANNYCLLIYKHVMKAVEMDRSLS